MLGRTDEVRPRPPLLIWLRGPLDLVGPDFEYSSSSSSLALSSYLSVFASSYLPRLPPFWAEGRVVGLFDFPFLDGLVQACRLTSGSPPKSVLEMELRLNMVGLGWFGWLSGVAMDGK